MKQWFSLLVVGLLASCAVYKTHNQTTKGKIRFPGGVWKNLTWDDSMYFRRASWYYGMTLYYDALFWNADPKSPFAQWFSEAEKEYFNKCEKLLISVAYSADPAKISHVMFREQMRYNGYDDVVVNTFASSLRTHPTYKEWNLGNYKITGFCKRNPSRAAGYTLKVSFPSFSELSLSI